MEYISDIGSGITDMHRNQIKEILKSKFFI